MGLIQFPNSDDEICTHEDAYGSTIIFVQSREKDGVCIVCDEYFPESRLLEMRKGNKIVQMRKEDV